MENVFLVIILTIIAVIVIATLKSENRVYGLCLSVAFGMAIIIYVWNDINYIISSINIVIKKMDSGTVKYVGIIIKISIIALLGEWVVSICADAGENSLATKMQIIIKIMMTALSFPILIGLAEVLISIIGEISNA